VFICPSCGQTSISIIKEKDYAIILCSVGECEISHPPIYKIKISRNSENIDIYGDFMDLFKLDSEIYRIKTKINSIMDKDFELKELHHYYLIISDLLDKKRHYESDPTVKQLLKKQISEYEIKRAEIKNKIEILESKGKELNTLSTDTSKRNTKIKKTKSVDEVFGEENKGFLEF
jgi:transcription elongation factor Elf1